MARTTNSHNYCLVSLPVPCRRLRVAASHQHSGRRRIEGWAGTGYHADSDQVEIGPRVDSTNMMFIHSLGATTYGGWGEAIRLSSPARTRAIWDFLLRSTP